MPDYSSASAMTPIATLFNNYKQRTYKPTNLDGLAALTGMTVGDKAYVTGIDAEFAFTSTGWRQQSSATFATEAARNSAYAQASGAYRVQGAEAVTENRQVTYRWFEAYNATTNPSGARTAGWYPVSGLVPRVSVTKNIAQNGSTSAVIVQWNNAGADFDRFAMYTSASNTRVTLPFEGVYRVTYNIGTSSTVARTARLRLNAVDQLVTAAVGASGAASHVLGTTYVLANAGQYIDVTVQDAATGVNMTTGLSAITVEWVEPRSNA